MKIFKTFLLLSVFVLSGVSANAQSADKILSKYVKAIGGKEQLSKIKSLYTESEADIMGMESLQKVTILNGKGYLMELEIMGEAVTNCITAEGGWTINPMAGSYDAEDMPEEQFLEAKSQIHLGGPFTVYAEAEYTAEALGQETVDGAKAEKVKLTAPGGTPTVHFFDAETGLLIKSVQEAEVEGQVMETIVEYSDYKVVDGINLPHQTDIDAGGMFQMTSIVSKVEVNKDIDPAIFKKP